MVAQLRVRVLFFGDSRRRPLDVQPDFKPFRPVHRPRLDLRAQERFSARQHRRADAHIHGGFQPLPVRVKADEIRAVHVHFLRAFRQHQQHPNAARLVHVGQRLRQNAELPRLVEDIPLRRLLKGQRLRADGQRHARFVLRGDLRDLNRPVLLQFLKPFGVVVARKPQNRRRAAEYERRRQQRRDRRAPLGRAPLGMQLFADRAQVLRRVRLLLRAAQLGKQRLAGVHRVHIDVRRRLAQLAVDFRPQRPSRVVRAERPGLDFPAQHIHFFFDAHAVPSIRYPMSHIRYSVRHVRSSSASRRAFFLSRASAVRIAPMVVFCLSASSSQLTPSTKCA